MNDEFLELGHIFNSGRDLTAIDLQVQALRRYLIPAPPIHLRPA